MTEKYDNLARARSSVGASAAPAITENGEHQAILEEDLGAHGYVASESDAQPNRAGVRAKDLPPVGDSEGDHTRLAGNEKSDNDGVVSIAATSGSSFSGRLGKALWRLMELVLSAFILIGLSPLLLVLALAIRLDSPGSVLFRHERVGKTRRVKSQPRASESLETAGSLSGKHYVGQERRKKDRYGQPFPLFKFRTMYVDARERFPELYAYEYTADELDTIPIKVLVSTARGEEGISKDEKLGNDPRVTRVGRFLRRTSLDELPNFINVLRGDLSLVGPRPDIEENIRWYRPEHMEKLQYRPGVTGLAQIAGRGMLSFHRTNELDIEYIRNQSALYDLKIIFNTIWVAIKRDGAY